jgi:hypothetical protein
MIMRFISKALTLIAFCGMVLGVSSAAAAQDKPNTAAPPSLCSRDNALEIIDQQIGASRTFDNGVPRITVLIRAAELLWIFQQKKSRAAFTEAFDVAVQNFKEKGDEVMPFGKNMMVSLPDPRYTVIEAIAKHDAAWAKKLTDQLLKEEQQEAEDKPTKDIERDRKTAEKLVSMASSLLPSDEPAAVNFARQSLRYPATYYLSAFLYQLAGINKAAADQFYQEALAAYAGAPMERLLYLSSYPFGNDREAGEMPGYMIYQVPGGFAPNSKLQRMFVQTILQRVREAADKPAAPGPDGQLSEPEQMWLALTRLETQIQHSLPDLAAEVKAARGNLYMQLSPNSQRQVGRMATPEDEPHTTFDEQVEAAQKNPNVDERDRQLALAITGASKEETLDHVLSALDEIADSTLRPPLLSWLYFERTVRATKDQKLDEARKLAVRVEELDVRAWLYLGIAEESLKHNADQTEAREVLEEVLAAAAKAPNTPVTARALMGVAYLYTKIDMNRAVAVMAEAVKCINRIEQPDFSQQFVIRKIEGKTFATYAGIYTPGFGPEAAFREIGKIDFDNLLSLASTFSDKYLRASTTLVLMDVCLQQKSKPVKPVEKNPKPISH